MNNGQIFVALAGNPNTGKTSLFNKLVGANQKVGNFPGVTVEKYEGTINFNSVEGAGTTVKISWPIKKTTL